MAIFEFSSSNGFSSFTLYFECRGYRIKEKGGETNNHFSYQITLPPKFRSDTSCDVRGYEVWDRICPVNGHCSRWIDCTTTFQGKQCSMI